VSPDGRKIAFIAPDGQGQLHLWIRSLDSLDARVLPGIEIASGPLPFFWSYDSRFIAFRSPDNKLKKADVSGGPAQTVCDVRATCRDGVIVYGDVGSGLMRVSPAGGTPTALTAPDLSRQENGHVSPKLLPDGRHFLYFRYSSRPGNSGIYVGSIDAKPTEQSSQPLFANQATPVYSSRHSATGPPICIKNSPTARRMRTAAEVG
jgi:Tol biopolymer transport system component